MIGGNSWDYLVAVMGIGCSGGRLVVSVGGKENRIVKRYDMARWQHGGTCRLGTLLKIFLGSKRQAEYFNVKTR